MSKNDQHTDHHYSQDDLKYMASLSSAVLQKTTTKSKYILWIMALSIVWLIIWGSFAEIDELARGQGKVIPSKQVQVVQNLEGGIVAEVFVREGQQVKKGERLLRLDDMIFSSSLRETEVNLSQLKAQTARLKAEAAGQNFAHHREVIPR